jgi:hypothetical protein
VDSGVEGGKSVDAVARVGAGAGRGRGGCGGEGRGGEDVRGRREGSGAWQAGGERDASTRKVGERERWFDSLNRIDRGFRYDLAVVRSDVKARSGASAPS